jgi:hypothetical protein
VTLLLCQSGRHLSLPQIPRHLSQGRNIMRSCTVAPGTGRFLDRDCGLCTGGRLPYMKGESMYTSCEPPPSPGGAAQSVHPPWTNMLPATSINKQTGRQRTDISWISYSHLSPIILPIALSVYEGCFLRGFGPHTVSVDLRTAIELLPCRDRIVSPNSRSRRTETTEISTTERIPFPSIGSPLWVCSRHFHSC